jgi:hypothetical protein
MALTDESSLLRERLREQQDIIEILRDFVLEFHQTGNSPRGKEWAQNYLDNQKPQDKTISE